jgi:ABC-type dipeptide/oligopeptide/nickel transport system permease component
MLEVLSREFILTAKSKGLEKDAIIYRHALPNALLPVITTIGMNAGYILAGAVLTETVFAWPGLGRLMFDSILARDYPVIMAMLVITSILVVLSNFVTDLLYSCIDPRVTYE